MALFLNSRKKWLDDIENDWNKMGIRGWRKIAKDRDAWKLILRMPRSYMNYRASGEGGGRESS
jgi:hypothetical protein